MKEELLKDLGEAAAAVLREGLRDLTPETLNKVHNLVGLGKADLQILVAGGAIGTTIICALTQRDADPVVLFRIEGGKDLLKTTTTQTH